MNCIIIDDVPLARKLIETHVEHVDFLNLLHSFNDPITALAFLSKNNVDLIFLDIEMPEMTGIEFIQTFQQKMPQIILTTSHKGFAIEAFENNITDYLVKPISYSRFYKAVTRAKSNFDKQLVQPISDDTLFVKKGNSLVRINKSDILWVEALGDYVTLNTDKDKFVVHASMNKMGEKLSANDYLRVHRSFIIRIDKIDSIEDDTISYKEKLIPIGKTYKTEVYKRLQML